jgi:cellulose synthase/poly-beta-1,6-N-acetylglucosamine synthase-like glycosyltransferase
MDADTILDPMWFQKALPALMDNTIAVCGHRRERFPEKNIYHMLTDMEWHYEVGPCRYFGGEVLIKREALEKTGGFDENLVAGEDPELSYRIRQHGWQIMRMDIPMTTHDIHMTTFRQYLKRAYRSGHAYAEIGTRFMKNREKLWLRELIRISAKALIPVLLILAGILLDYPWVGIILGALTLCKPFLRLPRLKQTFKTSWKKALLYVCHSIIVVYPQFWGVLRYAWGRVIGRPLHNKGVG